MRGSIGQVKHEENTAGMTFFEIRVEADWSGIEPHRAGETCQKDSGGGFFSIHGRAVRRLRKRMGGLSGCIEQAKIVENTKGVASSAAQNIRGRAIEPAGYDPLGSLYTTIILTLWAPNQGIYPDKLGKTWPKIALCAIHCKVCYTWTCGGS